MKNKKISLILIIILIFNIFLVQGFAGQKQDQLDELNKDKKEMQKKLSENKKQQNEISNQIATMQKKIQTTESEIGGINNNIQSTINTISKKEKELKDLEATIGENQRLLKKRLRVMYKTSNVEYLEIALSSKDVTELLSNLDMVKNIVKHDKQILSTLRENKEKVEQTKKILQDSKNNMIKMKNSLDAKKTDLEISKGEQAKLKEKLQADAKKIESDIDQINKESEQIRQAILREQSSEKYTGGVMKWPFPGQTGISSPYGNRYHPVLKKNKFHSGIDIPGPGGGTIVAANDGTVTFAGWSGGYGNMVRIDHGGKIMTVYAHNSSLIVKKGDKVKKGDPIARCGSTGLSTGNHLHFEVRVNGSTTNPISYVTK